MPKTLDSLPADDGFAMPGEFERHRRCWLVWPERTEYFRQGAKPAQRALVRIATAIAQGEPVAVCVSARQFDNAVRMLPPQVRVIELSTDDMWIRDCGPCFVRHPRGEVRVVDFAFNGWAGLAHGLPVAYQLDDLVPRKIAQLEGMDRYVCDLVAEGGNLCSDGQGTLIVTAENLLDPARNTADRSRQEIESVLCSHLGARKVIWLERGLRHDVTLGHCDNLACFVRPGVVVQTWVDDPADPQFDVCREVHEVLARATDARGRALEVHRLHQPEPMFVQAEDLDGLDAGPWLDGRRVGDPIAASYVNFYIANRAIVMPGYGTRDESARATLQGLFPERPVLVVPAREILLGGGSIHCITQQQPE